MDLQHSCSRCRNRQQYHIALEKYIDLHTSKIIISYTNLLDWQAHELEQAKRTFGWDKILLLFIYSYIDSFHLLLMS